jgi:hypothetical protein
MKCSCGGLMRSRLLTADKEANICIACGRDDMPRRKPSKRDREEVLLIDQVIVEPKGKPQKGK